LSRPSWALDCLRLMEMDMMVVKLGDSEDLHSVHSGIRLEFTVDVSGCRCWYRGAEISRT
jgi:hypothetical protein